MKKNPPVKICFLYFYILIQNGGFFPKTKPAEDGL